MKCIAVLSELENEDLERIVDEAAHRARLDKDVHILIIFLANSVENVFKYRDVVTKYIDMGVRLYIVKKVEELNQIIKNCSTILISHKDEKAKAVFDREVGRNIVEIP